MISCVARDEYSFREGPRDRALEELAEDIACPLPHYPSAKVPSSSLPFHEFSIFSWVIFTIILTSGNFSNSKEKPLFLLHLFLQLLHYPPPPCFLLEEKFPKMGFLYYCAIYFCAFSPKPSPSRHPHSTLHRPWPRPHRTVCSCQCGQVSLLVTETGNPGGTGIPDTLSTCAQPRRWPKAGLAVPESKLS